MVATREGPQAARARLDAPGRDRGVIGIAVVLGAVLVREDVAGRIVGLAGGSVILAGAAVVVAAAFSAVGSG